MKSLYLLRHAKSDWTNHNEKDFDRGLNPRGMRVAPKMGRKLQELGVVPDAVIASPAVRAKATAEFVTEQLEYDLENIIYKEEIYEASVRSLLELVNKLDNEYDKVILIGHNPSFTYLSDYLSDEEIGNIPTCGCVGLRFHTNDWGEVSKSTGDLEWFIYPAQFNF